MCVCRGVRHGSSLAVDKFAAGAPRTPQTETEDKIGQSEAAGDPRTPPVANPSRPRAQQIRDVQVSLQPSTSGYKFSTAKSSSSSSSSPEESGLSWQTVPVVEAVILPPGRRLHRPVVPQVVKQETHDSESHFPIPKRDKTSARSHTRTIKQEVQSGIQSGVQSWQPASPSPLFKHSRSIMSPPGTGRGASKRGRGRGRGRRPSSPETATATGSSSSYTRPPHPYSTGKVSKVNICPICEKYTVTELDRPADSDPNVEALRARFKCELCTNIFDLGISLFDPRGSPGVTLYEGEDRFVHCFELYRLFSFNSHIVNRSFKYPFRLFFTEYRIFQRLFPEIQPVVFLNAHLY